VFRLPDATLFPGRIYILRNVSNVNDAIISTTGTGVEFFAGNNSTTGTTTVNLAGSNTTTKTLIFLSDGSNWTYGHLGF
jgi:MinD-like ATPase involved in chromosome partitioning or flagellar assembly